MVKSAYLLVCLSSFFLYACGSNIETFNSTQGLAKQLDDLHKAYNASAITEPEYKKAKEILIEHYQ